MRKNKEIARHDLHSFVLYLQSKKNGRACTCWFLNLFHLLNLFCGDTNNYHPSTYPADVLLMLEKMFCHPTNIYTVARETISNNIVEDCSRSENSSHKQALDETEELLENTQEVDFYPKLTGREERMR